MTSKKKDDIKIVRSNDHRSHYVTGAIPQWTENDLRLHLYNEVIDGPKGSYYISTSQIILPRSAVPKLMEALKNAVKNEKKMKTEKVEVPPELFKQIERDAKDRAQIKKKVQKIRRK